VNPDLLSGWGHRPVDYQWGVNLQQQIVPRVSLEVGYNRRWWGNFTVTDNLAVAPSDYEAWTLTAPQDSRLPGGGGYPITTYTLTSDASRRPADNYVTWETDFGKARTDYWQGVDVTMNARLKQGLTLQGGTTTGRTIVDTCDSQLKIDSPDPRNCRSEEPYQTTFRGLASYTVPKVGVLVSGTLRIQPPLQVSATNGSNWLVPNTVVQDVLGRIPPGVRPTATPRFSWWTTVPTGSTWTTTARSSTCGLRRSSGSGIAGSISASTSTTCSTRTTRTPTRPPTPSTRRTAARG
jgi:hypothetical protein